MKLKGNIFPRATSLNSEEIIENEENALCVEVCQMRSLLFTPITTHSAQCMICITTTNRMKDFTRSKKENA
jgi:hypothetical protein